MTMKKYRTTSVLALAVGTLVGLTPGQASARSHALKPTGEQDVYEVVGPMQFKVGETIGLPVELPKGLAAFVEDPDAPAEPAPKVDIAALQAENAALSEAIVKAGGERDAALASVATLQAEREFVGTLLTDEQRASLGKWTAERKAEADKAAAEALSLATKPGKRKA